MKAADGARQPNELAVLDGEVGGAFSETRHLAGNDPAAEAAPVAASQGMYPGSAGRQTCEAFLLRAERVPAAVSIGQTTSPAEFVPRPAGALCPVVLCPVERRTEVAAPVPTPSFAA